MRTASRFCAFVLLVLTVSLFSACSSTGAIPHEFELQLAGSAEKLDANTKLLAALNQPVTLNFADTPLRDALAQIAKQTAIPLAVDWDALKDTDMKPKTLVTMQLANAPLREAFNMLFRTISAPDLEDSSAVWMATDGVVVVGTVASLLPHRKTIDYPVTDILDNLDPGAESAPEREKSKATSAFYRIANPPSPPAPPTPGDDDNDDDAVRDALFDLVEQASGVRPEMWDSHDGVLCVMNESAGVLVVTAPDEVHRRIFRALSAVRATIDQEKK